MKLKDIADMQDYLEHRCYCPGEIYDMSGFFYQVFSPEADCLLMAEGNKGAIHGKFVIAISTHKDAKSQIIYIEIEDDKVHSCVRLDATENNISQIMQFMRGEIKKMVFDEYKETDTAKALDEILSIADAIMI